MAGSLRWLGIGPPPAVGISYDDRFVVVALVHPRDRRIRGVGVIELDPRTVMSGAVERPAELAAAVGDGLASLRLPAGAPVGVCLPTGLDHRGSAWPATAVGSDAGGDGGRAVAGDGEVVVGAARSAGLDVRSVAPAAIVGARLGQLAAGDGADGRDEGSRQEPVSVVVRSGWLCSVVSTASRYVESRTERNDEFRTPPDVRWGLSSERAGAEIDPFTWPKRIRGQRHIALLAAGAAMLT